MSDTVTSDTATSDTAISGPTLAQLTDEAVLKPFLPERAIGYYQARFAQLIAASGLGDKPLSELTGPTLFAALLRARVGRVPFGRLSQFNWAAFFGTLFWVAWRRVAAWPWILIGVGLLSALMLALEDWVGLRGGRAIGLAVSFVIGLIGNDLLLVRIASELRTQTVRARPSRKRDLVLAGLALVVPAIIVAAVDDLTISSYRRSCLDSRNAPQAVIGACSFLVDHVKLKTETTVLAHFNRGLAYWRLNDADRAIAEYSAALQFEPNYAKALYNRGLAWRRKGDDKAALADYTAAIAADQKFAVAYTARSSVREVAGDLAGAAVDLEEAIRLDPKAPVPFSNLARLQLRTSQLDAAVENLDHAIELDPNFADAHNNRGYAFLLTGEAERALADFDTAIRLKPDSARQLINRGAAHVARSEYGEARADFDNALRLERGNALALYGRGVARAGLGDGAGADTDRAAATAAQAKVNVWFDQLVGPARAKRAGQQ